MNNAVTLPLSAGFGTPMPLLKHQRQAAAEAGRAALADLSMPTPAPALPHLPGRRRQPLAVAAMVVVHLLLLWALGNLDRVQDVVREHAPLFVSFVGDSAPLVRPPAPLPVPPAPQRPPVLTLALPPPPVVANVITLEVARSAPAVAAEPARAPAAATPTPAPAMTPVVSTPPTPAPPAAPAAPRQIPSSGVQFTEPPVVEYPKASRRNGEAGTVIVRAYVGTEGGAPHSVQIEQSCGFVRLDQAALAAVQRARFKPYTDNGRPVEGWALIPIQFELEK